MRRLNAAVVLAGTIALLAGAAPRDPQIPETFTNLQVLARDTPRPALVDIMRSFALGLGVRCEQCHVGAGNDLTKFDFASDEKADKGIARRMMRMVAVDNDALKGIGDAAPSPKVTCYTCHRGARTPAVAPPGRGMQ